MAEIRRPDEPSTRRIRFFARGIALVWAVGWTSLVLGQAFLWSESPAGEISTVVIVCLVLMGSALIGWRCEGIGAIVLVSEGCGVLAISFCLAIMGAGDFTFMRAVVVICGLALPALAAGLLFHACWRRSGDYRAAHMFKVATEWDIVSLVSALVQALIS